MRRVGILGGSFDPIHMAHMVIAQTALQTLRLDKLIFIPAYRSPLKRSSLATPLQRLQMVRLAIQDNPGLSLSDIEIRRQGPSYTVDTLRYLRRRYPSVKFYMILGSDSIRSLQRWRDVDQVSEEVIFAVVRRPGYRIPERLFKVFNLCLLDTPQIDISSSLIRSLVRKGKSIRYLVPEAVRRYIIKNRIYQ
jgi:nicotinate-nucleotide adenylyltransferase